MNGYESKTFKAQVEILKSRNMSFKDEERAAETLSYISYYTVKEFARPFNKGDLEVVDYENKEFEHIISRYYQDKNFRIDLLHALEVIEVAVQTQIAYVLGKKTGDYGYLDFRLWADTNNSEQQIKKIQKRILKDISYQVSKTKVSDPELSVKLEKGSNSQYPPVWFATKMVMFGGLVQMLDIMSKDNLKHISNYFGCKNNELLSWMKCLNLVRNIAAHNSNLIDFQLRTRPIIRDEWKEYLYKREDNLITNRIALPIIITKYFINEIVPKYKFGKISNDMQNLIKKDKFMANYYGFYDENSMQLIHPVHKKRKFKKR